MDTGKRLRLRDFTALLVATACLALSASAQDLPKETEKAIRSLIKQFNEGDGFQAYKAVTNVRTYGTQALPFLIDALKSGKAPQRKWSARAITEILGERNDAATRETAKAAGPVLLKALSKEKDAKAAWYIIQAIGKVKPDAEVAVPTLIDALRTWTSHEPLLQVLEAIGAYGPQAQGAHDPLLELVRTGTDHEARSLALRALLAIGLTPEDRIALSQLRLQTCPALVGDVFAALSRHESLALDFLEAHPDLLPYAGCKPLLAILEDSSGERERLKQYLRKRSDLPIGVMVLLGDPEFLPRIQNIEPEADPYRRTQLDACARALGATPSRVVRISEGVPGDFQPESAWPRGNRARMDNMLGHSDGVTEVLITGRILMKDGSPVVQPAFTRLRDPYYDGKRWFKYNPTSGRFLYMTQVKAAYATTDNGREPGPFSTCRAEVHITAKGARPLNVSFYDEMPEVEITLQPGESEEAPPPAIVKASEPERAPMMEADAMVMELDGLAREIQSLRDERKAKDRSDGK